MNNTQDVTTIKELSYPFLQTNKSKKSIRQMGDTISTQTPFRSRLSSLYDYEKANPVLMEEQINPLQSQDYIVKIKQNTKYNLKIHSN